MSFTDDESAKLEERIDRAWQRCRYGKNYSPAYEVARRIDTIRRILWKREHIDHIPNLNWWERKFTMQTAGILLMSAITTSKKLRAVADALDAEENESPSQANILRAYEDCIEGRYPPTIVKKGECFLRCRLPTLAELRDAFITRFGPDGKTLIMDADTGAEHERKNWDGPQPAVYAFDLATEKTKRLTAKDDFVWEPCWLSNEEFLCVIQKENESEPSLYRMPMSGKSPKLLAKHARTPSVSTP